MTKGGVTSGEVEEEGKEGEGSRVDACVHFYNKMRKNARILLKK